MAKPKQVAVIEQSEVEAFQAINKKKNAIAYMIGVNSAYCAKELAEAVQMEVDLWRSLNKKYNLDNGILHQVDLISRVVTAHGKKPKTKARTVTVNF